MNLRQRRGASVIGTTGGILFVVTFLILSFTDSETTRPRRLANFNSSITAQMVADHPTKFIGQRIRLKCRIDTFIDGPIEGPSAYASCPPQTNEHFILRGDQFRDLAVDDVVTVTGIVKFERSASPMGGQVDYSTIDIDQIDSLIKAPDSSDIR